jgi:hypothetical protein
VKTGNRPINWVISKLLNFYPNSVNKQFGLYEC